MILFIIITVLGISFYIWEYKILALIIFFFFLTSGFDLISSEEFELVFISNGLDYALIFLYIVIFIDILCIRNFLKIDNFVKFLLLFGVFLAICIFYSKFIIGISWFEIIKTCRPFFILPIYFLLKNLNLNQLENIFKFLFITTVFISVLYILQIITNNFILAGKVRGRIEIFGFIIPRYYNQPSMLHFFSFVALFYNPYKGSLKVITSIILLTALIGAFHRSLIICFIISIIISYIATLPKLRQIQITSLVGFMILFGSIYISHKLAQSKTYTDIKVVLSGDIAEMALAGHFEITSESTFTYRIAHLFERIFYINENHNNMIWGIGLQSDYSAQAKQLDFKIGLADRVTGEIQQIRSPDISYSALILHLGYLGTGIYLIIYIYLFIYFYKNRKIKYGLPSFAYMILTFGTSFFSENLLHPITFVMPLLTYTIIKKKLNETQHKGIHNNSIL